MEIFVFHLMPWDRLLDDFELCDSSAWTLPNSTYQPQHGHELYNRYLDELLLAEDLGFDGACVNEQHQTAYGTVPSPNLVAAIMARQTRRLKIGVLGNALPLYNPPTRLAEELAMIDVISNGRLVAGLGMGGGPDYCSATLNPTLARGMYEEAFDLIIRAWTESGPFEHYGEHWRLKCVNPWPRPLQTPHPSIRIPGDGSQETMAFAAQRRYGYIAPPYYHLEFLEKHFSTFGECCQKNGFAVDPSQLGCLLPIYVAETDQQAWEEFESHLWYFAKQLLKGYSRLPPGYCSVRSIARNNRSLHQFLGSVGTRRELENGAYAAVGSPSTVRDRLLEYTSRLGVGHLSGLFQIGTLPTHLTRKSMTLFAEQVMPQCRAGLPQP